MVIVLVMMVCDWLNIVMWIEDIEMFLRRKWGYKVVIKKDGGCFECVIEYLLKCWRIVRFVERFG